MALQVNISRYAVTQLGMNGGLVDRAVARAAGRTRDRAKMNLTQAPLVDTGALRQSVVSERVTATGSGQVTYQVGSPLEYAIYHERGTGIHGPHGAPIVPRRARVLRFKPGKNSSIVAGPDGYVYARSVQGVKATRWLTRALNALTAADFR